MEFALISSITLCTGAGVGLYHWRKKAKQEKLDLLVCVGFNAIFAPVIIPAEVLEIVHHELTKETLRDKEYMKDPNYAVLAEQVELKRKQLREIGKAEKKREKPKTSLEPQRIRSYERRVENPLHRTHSWRGVRREASRETAELRRRPTPEELNVQYAEDWSWAENLTSDTGAASGPDNLNDDGVLMYDMRTLEYVCAGKKN